MKINVYIWFGLILMANSIFENIIGASNCFVIIYELKRVNAIISYTYRRLMAFSSIKIVSEILATPKVSGK